MRSRILIAVLSLIATPALAQDLVVDAVRNCVYYSEAATLAQKAALRCGIGSPVPGTPSSSARR
jgi:hypothetical protein